MLGPIYCEISSDGDNQSPRSCRYRTQIGKLQQTAITFRWCMGNNLHRDTVRADEKMSDTIICSLSKRHQTDRWSGRLGHKMNVVRDRSAADQVLHFQKLMNVGSSGCLLLPAAFLSAPQTPRSVTVWRAEGDAEWRTAIAPHAASENTATTFMMKFSLGWNWSKLKRRCRRVAFGYLF